MSRRRALLELVAGYLAGVFMFSAVGSVAILFVVDLVTEVDTVVSRIPYVIGVTLVVSVFLFTRFKRSPFCHKFASIKRLKLKRKNHKNLNQKKKSLNQKNNPLMKKPKSYFN